MHRPTQPPLDHPVIPLLSESADDAAIPTLTERVDVLSTSATALQRASEPPGPALEQPTALPPAGPPADPAPPEQPAEPLARIELELQAAGRQIVNRLVAEQLPLIEQELRQRLEAQLGQLLRAGRR